MRKCMMTDVAYSKMMRGFDERNTRERHSLQPEVVSTGIKRGYGNISLTDDVVWRKEGLWFGMFTILYDWLRLRGCDRSYFGRDTPGE
jgi:hypothetical protein